jgi:RNA-directed DNA polymerase
MKTQHPSPRHFSSNLMSRVCTRALLEQAKTHVYRCRLNDHHNSDIWDLCFHWETYRDALQQQLIQGTYQLSPLSVFGSQNGHRLTRWSARDAVVLKALTIVLTEVLTPVVDPRCHHVTGNGGLKGAVGAVRAKIKTGQYRHLIKSDIANYYASMDHELLLGLCKKQIKDTRVINLLQQYMNRVEVHHGNHDLIEQGIAKGCPLSPLMGALMLKSLDKMIPDRCAYVRHMDDWVILTRTRHQLRRVVKNMHEVVRGLKLTLALDKTFIGKIRKGVDFLGYRFGSLGVIGLAQQTINNHKQKLLRLYEQSASDQRVEKYKTKI